MTPAERIESLQKSLTPGEKVTLVRWGEFGFVHSQQVVVISTEKTKWAQYNNALKVVYKEKKKRNARQVFFYTNGSYESLPVVFKGWVTPDTRMIKDGSCSTRLSFDDSYMTDAIASIPEAPLFA